MKLLIKKVVGVTFAVITLSVAVSLTHATRIATASFDGNAAALFKDKCASCHGEDGTGNTPPGKQLKVRNLRSAEVQKQSDAQLAAVIAKGKDKMPPFEKSLSKEQVSQLVAHIRQFGKK